MQPWRCAQMARGRRLHRQGVPRRRRSNRIVCKPLLLVMEFCCTSCQDKRKLRLLRNAFDMTSRVFAPRLSACHIPSHQTSAPIITPYQVSYHATPLSLDRVYSVHILRWVLHKNHQRVSPPRVQNFVTLIAMEMHNSFEKQDSIHRDAMCPRLSLDTSRV
jgi:hypothetical protein